MKQLIVFFLFVFLFGENLFAAEGDICPYPKTYISTSCDCRYYKENNYTKAYSSYALEDEDPVPSNTNCVRLQVCSLDGINHCYPKGYHSCPATVWDGPFYYVYYQNRDEIHINPITGAAQTFVCCIGPQHGERPHGRD